MRHLAVLLFTLLLFSDISCSQGLPDKPIIIGLLVLENPEKDSTDLSAVHAIRMAIQQLNIPIELVIRSCDGPWGVTSKQVVDFVYKDKVDAIITSVDGRNAHLAEQVATKTHKPLIAARATDPTLTQAYVPWFFRITPDDKIQAGVLKNEVFDKRKVKHVAIVYPGSYNGTYSSQYFKDILDREQSANSEFISYDPLTNKFTPILDKLKKKDPGAVLFFGKARYSFELVAEVNTSFPGVPLFANLELLDNSSKLSSLPASLFVPMPAEKLSTVFIGSFLEEYNYQPGFVAGHAYDALNLLVDAILEYGTEFEQLQKGISETNRIGVTGLIRFDSHGNRDSEVALGEVRDLLIHNPK